MTRMASDIREASKPIYCSACFNSQSIRHIDFDASSDRGRVYGNDSAVPVEMDDLILCENCVKEGARLLGMEDESINAARIADLEKKLETKAKALEKAERWADTMEDALYQKRVEVDHRKKPRKVLEVA